VAKLAPLFAVALIATACGSHKAAAPPTPPKPGPGRILYQGADWAVTYDHGKAFAQRLVGNAWKRDTTGLVKVTILGPKPGSTGNPSRPQVAFEMSATTDLADSAVWVDGTELLGKGGGLTPTRGTVYGAPDAPLKPGKHTAVAYARTATHATAVAWTFST
jgi:hypothetical protein